MTGWELLLSMGGIAVWTALILWPVMVLDERQRRRRERRGEGGE